jgi:cyanophycin synthetase
MLSVILKRILMRLIDLKTLRGPNVWSVKHHKLIVAKIDIEEYEELPTSKIEGFAERLAMRMPSLIEHQCSENKRGGFFERVREGTWIGHVIEHIALELQWLADMKVGFGRTRSTGKAGIYNIVFAYEIEEAGALALNAAMAIVNALRDNTPYNIQNVLTHMDGIRKSTLMGPSTKALVDEAKRRNIPVREIKECDLVVLGQGIHQKKFQGSIVDSTSFLGVQLTDNKNYTKGILKEECISFPEGMLIAHPGDLLTAASRVGYPLVIKPVNGNHERGVTTNITKYRQLLQAFQLASKISRQVIAEKFIDGDDYRLLVVDFKLVAAAKRLPPSVTGNGMSSIRELVAHLNADPKRGDDHENILTKVIIDESTVAILSDLGLTQHSVLPAGQTIVLKKTANLSTGGTAEDVTDLVHPFNILLA